MFTTLFAERSETAERAHRQNCFLVSLLIAERGGPACRTCRRAWAVDVHRSWRDGGVLAVSCGCGTVIETVGRADAA